MAFRQFSKSKKEQYFDITSTIYSIFMFLPPVGWDTYNLSELGPFAGVPLGGIKVLVELPVATLVGGLDHSCASTRANTPA